MAASLADTSPRANPAPDANAAAGAHRRTPSPACAIAAAAAGDSPPDRGRTPIGARARHAAGTRPRAGIGVEFRGIRSTGRAWIGRNRRTSSGSDGTRLAVSVAERATTDNDAATRLRATECCRCDTRSGGARNARARASARNLG
jgi:hypothetical protein